MKKLSLKLVVSLIMETVKSETLIKGRVDKATDDKAASLAFEEEAGDAEFHERKLLRTLHTSVSRLVSKIGDYVVNVQASSADNVSKTYNSDNDYIELKLLVSDRFNESFLDPLAKLCAKFVEDHMLYLWWGTFNVKQAEFYKTLLALDIEDIQACFTKTSPSVPVTTYTSSIDIDDFIKTQLGSVVRVSQGESFTLTYQVSDGCIDDVEVLTDQSGVISVTEKNDKSFVFNATAKGVGVVRLYSRHDDSIYCDVTFIVT